MSRKMTRKQLKYFGKRKHKRRRHMAKKRGKKHRRRRHSSGGGHHRRRRRGGGGGWMPPRDDLELYAAAAGIGYLETEAKQDQQHMLNKIPRPVKQVGYTGGTALAAWAVAKFTGNKWARLLARAAATAAMYQMGRKQSAFDGNATPAITTLSGAESEDYLSGEEMAALEAEGTYMDGVAYDDAVHDADAYT